MKIDSTISISQTLKTETNAGARYSGLSLATLNDRLKNADHVFIISAYYDASFLENLFVRKQSLKSLTMIFNRAAASALPEQLAELKTLKRRLQERHGRKTLVDIKVASKKRFLHTKLYHFRRGKWARTLIGSPNATENGFCRNDELLVEIHGRDSTIEGYIDYTSEVHLLAKTPL